MPSLDVHASFISERNVDDALVGKSAHGCENSGFLASSHGGCRYEETAVFPPESSSLPLVPAKVPHFEPSVNNASAHAVGSECEGRLRHADNMIANIVKCT